MGRVVGGPVGRVVRSVVVVRGIFYFLFLFLFLFGGGREGGWVGE